MRIQSFRSRRAYVEGEVRMPGMQMFTDMPMTLPEAINRAGGITPAGDRSFVTLTRNNETTVIDLMQLQELGVNPNRILLESGDMVDVRNRDESKVLRHGRNRAPFRPDHAQRPPEPERGTGRSRRPEPADCQYEPDLRDPQQRPGRRRRCST